MPEPQSKPAVNAADENEIFAKDDQAQTTGTASIKIDVIANDIGDSLVVNATRDGRFGACTLTKDNKVKYRAEMGFDGKDRCAYIACLRGRNPKVCDEGWIYVEVFPSTTHDADDSAASNFADFDNGSADSEAEGTPDDGSLTPFASIGTIMAVDDGMITGLNQQVRIDVAANDIYVAVEDVVPTVTEITSSAFHGTCQVVTNKNALTNNNWLIKEVRYTPNAGFVGWDHCTYKICLWQLGLANDSVCDEAKVKIKVLENAITNGPTSEPTSMPTTTVTNGPTSQPTAMPTTTPKEEVQEEMSNKVDDEGPTEDLSNINPNLDPIAIRDTITVIEGTHAFIDVLANDFDLDGDELEIDSWTDPQYGGMVDRVDDVLRYLPENGFTGRDCAFLTQVVLTYDCRHRCCLRHCVVTGAESIIHGILTLHVCLFILLQLSK